MSPEEFSNSPHIEAIKEIFTSEPEYFYGKSLLERYLYLSDTMSILIKALYVEDDPGNRGKILPLLSVGFDEVDGIKCATYLAIGVGKHQPGTEFIHASLKKDSPQYIEDDVVDSRRLGQGFWNNGSLTLDRVQLSDSRVKVGRNDCTLIDEQQPDVEIKLNQLAACIEIYLAARDGWYGHYDKSQTNKPKPAKMTGDVITQAFNQLFS